MIDYLIILAAPGGAGKTEFRKRLLKHELRVLEADLGIHEVTQWRLAPKTNIDVKTSTEFTGHVIFEYNIQSAYCNGLPYEKDERILNMLREARETMIVTFWTPPDRLYQQRTRRDLAKLRKAGVRAYGFHRAYTLYVVYFLYKLCVSFVSESSGLRSRALAHPLKNFAGLFLNRFWAFYLRPDAVISCYRTWLKFCQTCASPTCGNLIIEHDKTYKIYSFDEWESAAQTYL